MQGLTGSTGNSFQDGSVRGIIFGALTSLLAFTESKVDWFTEGDILVLAPFLVALTYVLGGLFDRYVKPKL